MKKFATIVAIAMIFAGFSTVGAGSVQIADKLQSPIACISPNGENVFFLTRTSGTVPSTSIKALDTKSNTVTEIAKDCKPFFGSDATYLASDKYFCYIDTRDNGGNTYNIYSFPIGSSKSELLLGRVHPVVKMAVVRSTLVWFESGETMSIWTKALDSSSQPEQIASLGVENTSNISMFAFTFNNIDYVVYDDKSNNKSAIRLYNLSTKETTTIADTEVAEYSPRYQNGCIFYIKCRIIDPCTQASTYHGGSIECYSINEASTKSIYEFDGMYLPTLISNMRNGNNFFFTLVNRSTTAFECKKFNIGAQSLYPGFTHDGGSFISIPPESCNSNTVCFSEFTNFFTSSLYAYDTVSQTKTAVSETKDSEIAIGYTGNKYIYSVIELTPDSTPRMPIIKNIKLMSWEK